MRFKRRFRRYSRWSKRTKYGRKKTSRMTKRRPLRTRLRRRSRVGRVLRGTTDTVQVRFVQPKFEITAWGVLDLGVGVFQTANSPGAFIDYNLTLDDLDADALRPWQLTYSFYRIKRITMRIRPLFQRPQTDPYSEQQALTDSWVSSECPLMWRKYRTSQEGAEQKGPATSGAAAFEASEYLRFRQDNGTHVMSGYRTCVIGCTPCIESAILNAPPASSATINTPVYHKWLPLTYGGINDTRYYGIQILPDASNNIGYSINSSVSGTANTVARLAQRWTVQPYVTVEFKDYKAYIAT